MNDENKNVNENENRNEHKSNGSNTSTRTANDVENHQLDLIERRRIAESLSEASAFSPRTAMSLGLSSLSLR